MLILLKLFLHLIAGVFYIMSGICMEGQANAELAELKEKSRYPKYIYSYLFIAMFLTSTAQLL